MSEVPNDINTYGWLSILFALLCGGLLASIQISKGAYFLWQTDKLEEEITDNEKKRLWWALLFFVLFIVFFVLGFT